MGQQLCEEPARRLFTVNELVEAVRGSSRATWLRHWIPALRANGVLVKYGNRFLGNVDEIVDALAAGLGGAH
jgi:hypothetical protein